MGPVGTKTTSSCKTHPSKHFQCTCKKSPLSPRHNACWPEGISPTSTASSRCQARTSTEGRPRACRSSTCLHLERSKDCSSLESSEWAGGSSVTDSAASSSSLPVSSADKKIASFRRIQPSKSLDCTRKYSPLCMRHTASSPDGVIPTFMDVGCGAAQTGKHGRPSASWSSTGGRSSRPSRNSGAAGWELSQPIGAWQPGELRA
mmetsp:Transcript_129263/g.359987  ORF Transcript_129263/g.359987 Transcript_129263/m.359987 type:complete len:204 (+) Transcript_129263:382-993(+)